MFSAPFNASIWHALCVLVPILIIAYAASFYSLGPGWFYFDTKHNSDPKLRDAGDFEPQSKRYQDISKLAITLAAGAIAFLITMTTSEKTASPAALERIRAAAPITVGFFGFSIALLVIFIVSQTVWYEQYCHSPDHSTYERWKYAFCNTAGWTGMISFVLGFVWLARNLFH